MKTEPPRHELEFGSRRIVFSLHRSGGRRLRIAVTPEMQVEVFAPPQVSLPRILEMVRGKLPWITRKLDTVEGFHPLPTRKKYVSGETFLYLGRQYRLRIETGLRQPVKLKGRFLYVQVPAGTRRESIKTAVDCWYRQRGREIFKRYMDKWLKIAGRHGILAAAWDIRTMPRRWGSCGANGRITLNTKLVQAPVHCIEYVIIHELCHLKIANHSRKFYALLGCCMPDWSDRKDHLARVVV